MWQFRQVHSSASTADVPGLVPFRSILPDAPLCELWHARQLWTCGVSSVQPALPMSSCQGFMPVSFHVTVEVECIAGFVLQYLLSWQAWHRPPFSSVATMNLGNIVP